MFRLTQVQTCVVHLIRNCLQYASWKDRKALVAELKTIYRADTAEKAPAGYRSWACMDQRKEWQPFI
jgi:putative transposase